MMSLYENYLIVLSNLYIIHLKVKVSLYTIIVDVVATFFFCLTYRILTVFTYKKRSYLKLQSTDSIKSFTIVAAAKLLSQVCLLSFCM